MALISALTPLFVAILCVVIAFMFKYRERSDIKTSRSERSETEARPWVDDDLQDDTDISGRDNGIN